MACDVSNSNGSLGIYNGCAFVIERPELTMVDVRHLPEESCITEGSFGPTGMYQYYMTCYIVECLGGGGQLGCKDHTMSSFYIIMCRKVCRSRSQNQYPSLPSQVTKTLQGLVYLHSYCISARQLKCHLLYTQSKNANLDFCRMVWC